MASRASMYSSEKGCTNGISGVSLKSRALKIWLERRGITQREVARVLELPKQEFRQKLYKHSKFDMRQITKLIHLMGAMAAIKVIWFPTIEVKRRIKKYVTEGQMSGNDDIPVFYETLSERKRREVGEQMKESGKNWEQTEEFEDYIFDTDELPSRKFYRRRRGG